MYKATLAMIVWLLILARAAGATPLDDAVTAAHRGDYAAAYRLLRPLADKGDARAQFNLGYMYASGWGVRRDPAEAIKWYREAADQGLAIAQHLLGLAYANGDGVKPDDAEAAKWFTRAAAQGHAPAQFLLGTMYLDGRGVAKDPVRGYAWVVLSGRGGVRSAARVVPTLRLTAGQLAQAQEMLDRFKPKPESSEASVAAVRSEELLGLDQQIGEFADPASWPTSAIGVVAVARFSSGSRCSGALVGSKIVLTAAHCVFLGQQLANPADVHFLAGMNKGTPAASSVAERLIVSNDYSPGRSTVQPAADWALIVLKDAIPARPIPVTLLTRDELSAASSAGTVSQIGYGAERRYSPTELRNCRAGQAADNRVLLVRCLANFGYSGSPILADVNGTPSVVGVFSSFQPETKEMFVCSASQFDAAVKQLIAATPGPAH